MPLRAELASPVPTSRLVSRFTNESLHKLNLSGSTVGSFVRCAGFGFWLSGLGIRVSGFELQVLGLEFRVLGFGFRVSGFGFLVSWVGLSGFGSDLALLAHLPRLQDLPLHHTHPARVHAPAPRAVGQGV